MKAIIHTWAGGFDLAERTGFESGQEVDGFEAMKMIYYCGLNVMLIRGEEQNIVYVDNKNFARR